MQIYEVRDDWGSLRFSAEDDESALAEIRMLAAEVGGDPSEAYVVRILTESLD